MLADSHLLLTRPTRLCSQAVTKLRSVRERRTLHPELSEYDARPPWTDGGWSAWKPWNGSQKEREERQRLRESCCVPSSGPLLFQTLAETTRPPCAETKRPRETLTCSFSILSMPIRCCIAAVRRPSPSHTCVHCTSFLSLHSQPGPSSAHPTANPSTRSSSGTSAPSTTTCGSCPGSTTTDCRPD